jgi:hypothetical protein
MTIDAGGERRVMAIVGIALALLPLTTCTRWDRIYSGVQYSADGSRLHLASSGACGCVTLQNRSAEPLTLYASLHAGLAGSLVLMPRELARVRYDWAGSSGDDFYEIVAVRQGPGTTQTLATPLSDFVAAAGVTETTCESRACDYGALSMNKAATVREGGEEAQPLVQGVGFSKGDEVLQLAAPRGQCGCMLLRNISNAPLILRSSLRGRVIGGLTLPGRQPRTGSAPPSASLLPGSSAPAEDSYDYADVYVGFDWAGDLNRDTYEINALSPPGGSGEAAPDAASTPPSSSSDDQPADHTLKIGTYVRIVGRMDGMQCASRTAPQERTARAAAFLLNFQKQYPALDAALLHQMADFAAGVPGAPLPALNRATQGDISRVVEHAHVQNADGALFVLPTGDEIRCPFGDLYLDQVWPRPQGAAAAYQAPGSPTRGAAPATPPTRDKERVP